MSAEVLLDKLLRADTVDWRAKGGVQNRHGFKPIIPFVVNPVADAITMALWHRAISRMSSVLIELRVSVPLEVIDFQAEDSLFNYQSLARRPSS
jgi:hypothetical protein